MSQLRGYEVVTVLKNAVVNPGEIVAGTALVRRGKSSSVEGPRPKHCPQDPQRTTR